MARFILLGLTLVSAACGPTISPERPVRPARERPRAAKLTDSVAYQVYQRILAKARAAQKAKKPLELKTLLKGQVAKIPAGCDKSKTIVRRVLTPEDVSWISDKKRPSTLVALLLLQPVGYQHCECPSSCGDRTPELSQCSLGVRALPGGTPKLVVTDPELSVHAAAKPLMAEWSERPAGRLMLTLRFGAVETSCGTPDLPSRTRSETELVGVHGGRLHSYVSITSSEQVTDSKRGFEGTISGNASWYDPPDSKRQLLTITRETSRKDTSTPTSMGDMTQEERCTFSRTVHRLDLKQNKLVKLTGAALKRLLKPQERRELKPVERTGSNAAECEELDNS